MKVIAPRVPTSAPSALESHPSGGSMPAEFLSEQVKRLAVFAVVGAGLWSFGLFVDTVLVPLTQRPAQAGEARPVEIAGLVVSVLMFAYAKFSGHDPKTKINVGLGYMIFCAAGVGFINTQVLASSAISSNQISWNTLVILVSSMILQTSPWRMFAAAVAAASMDPIGVWLAHLRGLPTPQVWDGIVAYLPNYVCAVIAMVPSSVHLHLGRRLREAQDFGSYKLVELLGHGGMGEVWRAEHRLLARDVAIKLVRPEVLGGGDAQRGVAAVRARSAGDGRVELAAHD